MTMTESEALPQIEEQPAAPAAPVTPADPPAKRRPYLDLLLISFLLLFFELACIRWFGSMVIFLTYFTNIVLMACFLGMSVGCLAASRKTNFINWVIPLSLLAVAMAWGVFYFYGHFPDKLSISMGESGSATKLIYFGTEYRPPDPSRLIVPIWIPAGVFFALIALIFVGLGQVMGRSFDAIDNRVAAYTTNVFGSLLGIAAFFGASWFGTSPHLWFAICIVLVLLFVTKWSAVQIFGQLALLFIIAMTAFGQGEKGEVRWSPYYKIRYTPQTREIDTNNISHQQMVDIGPGGPGYALPHLLNRDAGNKPFKEILIIGAGSGNDVAAACRYGDADTHIDAVEIDPVIQSIGAADHPNSPYADPRVKYYNDDGRSFLKKNAPKKYDLIVYALVDSLVLHSGYSSIRLESFLFTEEAFADIRGRLKEDGVFCMYNYYRQGWVVGRLAKMALDQFGASPLVMALPYQAEIGEGLNLDNVRTFILVGNGKENHTVDSIRAKFAENGSFWVNERPQFNGVNSFRADMPFIPGAGQWHKIAPAKVDTAAVALTPTDNWPFLYLKDKAIPRHPSLDGILVIAAVSLVILLAFAPVRRIRPNGQMFFLGAGFMLLETKGVVHMALLFGSTWVVNSFVFAAILVMILCSNLYVLALRPRKLWPYYLLLAAALLVNVFVPMRYFLSLSGTLRPVVSCAVIFVPIFFAGVIFATSFRDSTQPDIDMGSNIAGIILGGLSEYFSLMLGFNYLLGIAIAFYLLSMVLRRRMPLAPAPPVV
ncbi:MAG TPA: hypothetical protein VIL86_20785, partial [Tepidisphaeraceae bacterium]